MRGEDEGGCGKENSRRRMNIREGKRGEEKGERKRREEKEMKTDTEIDRGKAVSGGEHQIIVGALM